MQENVIVGIDLAGTAKNPTGWAMWKDKVVSVHQLYDDEEILRRSIECDPALIAIDAPLSLPAEDVMRRADREMYKLGYPVFPPRFPSMEKLTLRAMKINRDFRRRGFHVIEVHPASSRKALKMPTKDWKKIQTIFIEMELRGDPNFRVLTPHQIDAITAALTGYLYLQGKTQLIGDDKEGYISVPLKGNWRRLRL